MTAPKRYRQSAGVLLYRRSADALEVLLGHPGGPLWARKDAGSWTIFKGEFDLASELPLEAAKREFAEETGFEVDGDFLDLGTIRQPSGKVVHGFALEHDLDAPAVASNLFELEWPPHSGKTAEFPEIDRAEWFLPSEARTKIMRGQIGFLERLADALERAAE